METLKLIRLVHSKECLWNQNNRLYHSRDVQRNGWKAISSEMKTPAEELKKKWKGLRDIFRREFKKSKSQGPGDPAEEYTSKWPFYNSLCFLKDQMCPKDSKDEVAVKIEEMDSDSLLDTHDLSQVPLEPSISMRVLDSPPPEKRVKTQNEHWEYEERQFRTQEENVKYFKDNTQDSEMQFLLSLLPFLKSVAPSRQLAVRANMMQVLAEEHATSSASNKHGDISSSHQTEIRPIKFESI